MNHILHTFNDIDSRVATRIWELLPDIVEEALTKGRLPYGPDYGYPTNGIFFDKAIGRIAYYVDKQSSQPDAAEVIKGYTTRLIESERTKRFITELQSLAYTLDYHYTNINHSKSESPELALRTKVCGKLHELANLEGKYIKELFNYVSKLPSSANWSATLFSLGVELDSFFQAELAHIQLERSQLTTLIDAYALVKRPPPFYVPTEGRGAQNEGEY